MPYKYFIGELGFTSKDATLKYTRSIIQEIGYRKIYPSDTYYQFLCDLLNNHTEKESKIGVGINHFEITLSPKFKDTYWLIHRIDGSVVDVSYNHCCKFKERPITRSLTDAMRYSVKDMTINFKTSKSILSCNKCHNSTLKYKEYHVDHILPFVDLYNKFMSSNTLSIPTVFNESDCNIACFRPDDCEFETNWIIFHNNNATLQILCKTCNLQKGKKRIV